MKLRSLLLSLACLHVGARLSAQVPVLVASPASEQIDLQADKVEYRGDNSTVVASGNVVISKGARALQADIVTYNTVTEYAFARGNVRFNDGAQVWHGEELEYNFLTGQGTFPSLDMQYDKIKIRAENSERLSDIQLRLSGVQITTCADVERPDFAIEASAADVYEGKVVKITNPVFYLHGIPLLWLPSYTVDLDRQSTHVRVVPGYASRDGVFALVSYSARVAEETEGVTHVDWRSERGWAVGQDFEWWGEDSGFLKMYYAADDAPYKDDDEEADLRARGHDIDEDRFRVVFGHQERFSDRDRLNVRAAYLSDTKVQQHFFSEEYEASPTPNNQIAYLYNGEGYAVGIEVTKQINDELFDGVSRLPEISLDVPRVDLWESGLMLESRTSLGFLERTFSDFQEEQGNEEYDTFRLHTRNMLFYPTRQFGWLNLTPRAGFAYTHYGDTRRTEQEVLTTESVDTNGVITVTTQTNDVTVATGADGRMLPELGLEVSFKAFAVLHDNPTALGRGLRHVVEPFANYTYIPEPDLLPENIYQFDAIDRLGENHSVAFGIRNKFQTKRHLGGDRVQIHDYADFTFSTVYDLRSEVEDPLGMVRLDSAFAPSDWITIELDAQYDPNESEIDRVNTQVRFNDARDNSFLAFDHYYRTDNTNLLSVEFGLNTHGTLGLSGATRYELDDQELESQSLMVTYVGECVGYGLGVKWIAGDERADGTVGDEDWKVWLQLWLTAYPQGRVDMGSR